MRYPATPRRPLRRPTWRMAHTSTRTPPPTPSRDVHRDRDRLAVLGVAVVDLHRARGDLQVRSGRRVDLDDDLAGRVPFVRITAPVSRVLDREDDLVRGVPLRPLERDVHPRERVVLPRASLDRPRDLPRVVQRLRLVVVVRRPGGVEAVDAAL